MEFYVNYLEDQLGMIKLTQLIYSVFKQLTSALNILI